MDTTQNLAQNSDAQDAAAARTAKAAKECACGNYGNVTTGERLVCNAETARTFAPGHDARLKGFLIRAGRADQMVSVLGHTDPVTAQDAAKGFGFAAMVAEGIAKGKAKPVRKSRAAKTAAPAADTTHDGNAARKAREAQSLADIVAAEEAKHAAEVAATRPAPEWDDEPNVAEVTTPLILEDEAAMNAHAQDARVAAGLVKAKVGRWVREGYVNEDGSLTFAKKMGGTETVPAGKYQLV